jgi:hypothetical protein
MSDKEDKSSYIDYKKLKELYEKRKEAGIKKVTYEFVGTEHDLENLFLAMVYDYIIANGCSDEDWIKVKKIYDKEKAKGEITGRDTKGKKIT